MTLGTVPSLLRYFGKKGLNWRHSSMLYFGEAIERLGHLTDFIMLIKVEA